MAVRLYSHEDVLKRLAPYGCKRLFSYPPGFEVWETGWGEAFTLKPEPPNQYSEDQLTRAMVVIAPTIPIDWFDNGKKTPVA